MKTPLKIIAIIGLALGGILGMVGTFVANQNVRAVLWAIDGASLIVATSLLALMYFRKGNDCVAAGFLVYAIGEAVMLGGTACSLEASVPTFAAGTALWSAALALTCVPGVFVIWTRIAGLIGAVLFAITSLRIFAGEQLLPISKPLPTMAYPFLVLTFVGWIWTLLKTE
ncbi:MAG: hypothetical protein ABR957_04095 [Terracidiphilus sp.]